MVLIVLDGCGAGEAPDAAAFNDTDNPSTLLHVWQAAGSIDAPNLIAAGFFAAARVQAARASTSINGFAVRYGRLRELSMGKDSVTGHWEMMGIETKTPFPTYPTGFPDGLVAEIELGFGTKTLGHMPASGTEIIRRLGPQHVRTGYPIVYTSADSVFQIACHETVVPLDRLYEMCRIAREICRGENNVQRVIARPFVGDEQIGYTRTGGRRDFPAEAPKNLVDAIGQVYGIGVVPELFAGRGFRSGRRTQSNREHEAALWDALGSNARFIFANFEDFDMLFGHRNDALGFANALHDFDRVLGELISRLGPEDLLLLTADHGNDPTTASTDHSREYVPVSMLAASIEPGNFGDIDGMMAVGRTVAEWLGVPWAVGVNLFSASTTG